MNEDKEFNLSQGDREYIIKAVIEDVQTLINRTMKEVNYKFIKSSLQRALNGLKPTQENTYPLITSVSQQFNQSLNMFLANRRTYKADGILSGLIYLDEIARKYYFKVNELHKFFSKVAGFDVYTLAEIRAKLRSIGARPERLTVKNKLTQERCWSLSIMTAFQLKEQ